MNDLLANPMRFSSAALQSAGCRLNATFMLPGNVYNYGEPMPAVLAQDTVQHPTTRKGRIRCEIEALLAQRAARGLDGVVIRAGDFFGGGTGSWLDLVITKSLGAGKLVYPGPLDRPHAWAYLPDLARAFVAAALRQQAQAAARPGRKMGHVTRLVL